MEREVVALILGRLAAPGSEGKTWRDAVIADSELIIDTAQDWQQTAARAVIWEIGGSLYGAGRDRAYEVAGRMAAVGEQLGLAYAAAVEAFFWKQAVDSAPERAAAHMGWRAMTELMSLYLLSAGHGLINVAVRVLAFDSALRDRAQKVFGMTLAPFSEEKGDSLSFNADTAKRLRRVGRRHQSPAVDALIEPLTALVVDPDWPAIEAARGKDYHRWRPQSLAILAQRSPWSRSGNTWSMGVPTQDAPDVDALARECGRVAEAAMGKLARAMDAFGTRFATASTVLGGPRFKLQSGETTTQAKATPPPPRLRGFGRLHQ